MSVPITCLQEVIATQVAWNITLVCMCITVILHIAELSESLPTDQTFKNLVRSPSHCILYTNLLPINLHCLFDLFGSSPFSLYHYASFYYFGKWLMLRLVLVQMIKNLLHFLRKHRLFIQIIFWWCNYLGCFKWSVYFLLLWQYLTLVMLVYYIFNSES